MESCTSIRDEHIDFNTVRMDELRVLCEEVVKTSRLSHEESNQMKLLFELSQRNHPTLRSFLELMHDIEDENDDSCQIATTRETFSPSHFSVALEKIRKHREIHSHQYVRLCTTNTISDTISLELISSPSPSTSSSSSPHISAILVNTNVLSEPSFIAALWQHCLYTVSENAHSLLQISSFLSSFLSIPSFSCSFHKFCRIGQHQTPFPSKSFSLEDLLFTIIELKTDVLSLLSTSYSDDFHTGIGILAYHCLQLRLLLHATPHFISHLLHYFVFALMEADKKKKETILEPIHQMILFAFYSDFLFTSPPPSVSSLSTEDLASLVSAIQHSPSSSSEVYATLCQTCVVVENRSFLSSFYLQMLSSLYSEKMMNEEAVKSSLRAYLEMVLIDLRRPASSIFPLVGHVSLQIMLHSLEILSSSSLPHTLGTISLHQMYLEELSPIGAPVLEIMAKLSLKDRMDITHRLKISRGCIAQ